MCIGTRLWEINVIYLNSLERTVWLRRCFYGVLTALPTLYLAQVRQEAVYFAATPGKPGANQCCITKVVIRVFEIWHDPWAAAATLGYRAWDQTEMLLHPPATSYILCCTVLPPLLTLLWGGFFCNDIKIAILTGVGCFPTSVSTRIGTCSSAAFFAALSALAFPAASSVSSLACALVFFKKMATLVKHWKTKNSLYYICMLFLGLPRELGLRSKSYKLSKIWPKSCQCEC